MSRPKKYSVRHKLIQLTFRVNDYERDWLETLAANHKAPTLAKWIRARILTDTEFKKSDLTLQVNRNEWKELEIAPTGKRRRYHKWPKWWLRHRAKHIQKRKSDAAGNQSDLHGRNGAVEESQTVSREPQESHER